MMETMTTEGKPPQALKLLNERRHSKVIFIIPAFSTEGCLPICSFLKHSVKNSLLVLQMQWWKTARKGTSGRVKVFQANCGSSSCIVNQQPRRCVRGLVTGGNALLWAAVRKRDVSIMKTLCTQRFFQWQKSQYFCGCTSAMRCACQRQSALMLHWKKVRLLTNIWSKISKWTHWQSDAFYVCAAWRVVWCIILHNSPHSRSEKP